MDFLSGVENENTNTFYFQNVLFSNEINHRVLQNENGPCPLLALINCMLLRGHIAMATGALPGKFPISFKALTDYLRNELERISQKLMEENSESSNAKIIQIAQCFELFPTLEKGLDINIKFNDVQSFDMQELAHQFFNIYNLNIYHCWVIDPDGAYSKIHHRIADKTYDQVQLMLIADDDDTFLINQFLQNTKQQRTKYGVHRLYCSMRLNEIATLFHNNHYSTIYKHADDNIIYELVTDEGIVHAQAQIMWKTFNPSHYIHGIDEIFVDCNFNALNASDNTQLCKLRRIVHHLSKYKYDTHTFASTLTTTPPPPRTGAGNALLKKIANALEFITKFPLNPLECTPIFVPQKTSHAKDDLHTGAIEDVQPPQAMTRALSDTIGNTLGSILPHTEQSSGAAQKRYNIRQCRVEDVQCICNELDFKDERFWTREFLTDNTNRNGYVLEDDVADIIGFILYEKCEPLINKQRPRPSATALPTTACMLVRDLSATESGWNEVDVDCKWRVSDWNKTKKCGKVTFYSQFVLVSDMVIHQRRRRKGYGSKLLQTIIYSFPSGTPFAAEIALGNDGAVHCFGKCGFVIARNEGDSFYMTLVSEYDKAEVAEFKQCSILKDGGRGREEIIKELKESKNRITYGRNAESKEEMLRVKEEEYEDIFMEDGSVDEKKEEKRSDDMKFDEVDYGETKEEEFDPEKLNRLLAELCCKEDTALIDCVLRVIAKCMNDRYERLDLEQLRRDFEQALYDPFKYLNTGNNYKEAFAMDEKESDVKNAEYVKLAFDVLYCAGFVKRRFGVMRMEEEDDDFYDRKEPDLGMDANAERFYLAFESDEVWKLEATKELIKHYKLHVRGKNKLNFVKAIAFDMNPSQHWKHIFDAEPHGREVRDKTIRVLKKICSGIVNNASNLQHRARNLNYSSLRQKFECPVPLSLLEKYGFEQREDLYKNEVRLVYKHQNVSNIKQMYEKIQYEEKLIRDADIFSGMDEDLQRLWIHCLSDFHGEKVKRITVDTLKNICKRIMDNPYDTTARNLSLMTLQHKFGCAMPLKLLLKYGFTQRFDFSSFGGEGIMFGYDSSDISRIKNMYSILEMDIDFNNILPNATRSPDLLRVILALKAAQQQQSQQSKREEQILAQLMNLNNSINGLGAPPNKAISFDNNDDLKSENNGLDFPMSALFGGGMNGMKVGNMQEMGFMEMSGFLRDIDEALSDYAGPFMNNGFKTKSQLLNIDVTFVEFIIDDKKDQNTFKNWLKQNQSKHIENGSNISGI